MATWWARASERRLEDHLQQLGRAPAPSGSADSSLIALQRYSRDRYWDPRVWYWLGARLTSLGRHREAVDALVRAAALNPGSASTRAALGLAMSRADQPENAEAQLKQAIALNPKLEFAHFALGSLYGQFKQWETAADQLKQAVAL